MAQLRPAKDSIWRCPCGTETTWQEMLRHRRGWKKRPDCTGSITPVDPPYTPFEMMQQKLNKLDSTDAEAAAPDDSAIPVSTPHHPALPEAPAKRKVYEYQPDPAELSNPLDDPEELARQFNLSSKSVLDDTFAPDIGGGGGIGGGEMPPGDWHAEMPPVLPPPSQARETVSLPIIVRVMYDWAKSEGWKKGDGSLSSFVTDCLLDHFNNCWDKAVVVVDRQEVLGG